MEFTREEKARFLRVRWRDAENCARWGELEEVKWLFEIDAVRDSYALMQYAAYGSKRHVIEWLRERGYPWSEWVFSEASARNDVELMKWLHLNGCPIGKWAVDEAVRRGNLEVIQWLKTLELDLGVSSSLRQV